jgi:hypothetical protein
MIVLQIRNTYYENYIFKNKEVKTNKATNNPPQKNIIKRKQN